MRIRSDVRKLIKNENTDWPAALVTYERGVRKMRALDPHYTTPPTRPTDKLCWQYLAAVHGRAADDLGHEDHSDRLWTTCQHGSWFFFPWHRMYLLTLEAFVQHFSGDPHWAVPYWYAIDPDDTNADVVPNAFLKPTHDNALYVSERSTRAKNGQPIAGTQIVSALSRQFVSNLKIPDFSTRHRTPSFGGGEYADPKFQHDLNGAVESIPHGPVHNLVGSDYDPNAGDPIPPYGFMTDLLTAARDPIFWLHHSNIDRLWQMWLDLDRQHHRNPNEHAWLETTFTFPTPDGHTRSWRVGDVLDPAALGYAYDTTAAPSTLPAPPAQGLGFEVGEPKVSVPVPPAPQLVGATVSASIGPDRRADIALSSPEPLTRAVADDEQSPPPARWLLRLEGVTGTVAAPLYSIYLNLPAGARPADYPDRLAGTISTFGVREASRSGGDHDGRGLTVVLDITDAHDALARSAEWDAANVNVAFVPLAPEAADEPAFAARIAAAPSAPQDVRAARIAVLVA
jgi:tyrosinase